MAKASVIGGGEFQGMVILLFIAPEIDRLAAAFSFQHAEQGREEAGCRFAVWRQQFHMGQLGNVEDWFGVQGLCHDILPNRYWIDPKFH